MARTNTPNNGAARAQLWQMADALRGRMDAAEHEHVVLGLMFLKCSDTFEDRHEKLIAERAKRVKPEVPDGYHARSILLGAPQARWAFLRAGARQRAIGRLLDMTSNIAVRDEASRAKNLLGRIYEYPLSQFASAERKKGKFYTPRCVIKGRDARTQPRLRVRPPLLGHVGAVGGIYPQRQWGKAKASISIYRHESNYTTSRLAKMNLATRGIDAPVVHGDTHHNDHHPDLFADFVLASPHLLESRIIDEKASCLTVSVQQPASERNW